MNKGFFLNELGDGAHRAFLDAVAARNAVVVVHGRGNAVDHFENLLGARVNADAAADALVGVDNGMRHVKLLLVWKLSQVS